jgi:hypothetical protein
MHELFDASQNRKPRHNVPKTLLWHNNEQKDSSPGQA